MWGESDPEWTAGDDAAGFTRRATVPTYPGTSAAPGEFFLTSRLHGRVRIPLGGTSEMGRSMTTALSDPEIQPDIQHRRGMGQGTHRDHVDTRGGDFPDCREVDPS